MTFALITFQTLLVLAAAPAVIGMIRKMKARFQNRQGASIFLPYWSLLSLFKKEMTVTRHSSWVFRVVPFVVFGSALFLAIAIPSFAAGILSASLSNIFLVGAVAALGSVFLVFGGMDTASTFGNMGSSREMTIASMIEPALYVSLASLAAFASFWSLDGIVLYFASVPMYTTLPAALSLIALVFVLLAENARYPVDNPATHLELTMVHEAMVLEYSGPYLALLEYASWIKLTAMLALVANLVFPWGILVAPFAGFAFVVALAAFVIKLALGAFVIAYIESTIVKMRFYRMQEYTSLALIIALGGLAVVLFTFAI
ncbi:NADH-quinone oxidoreductase subunit H [Candidatus Kaiserbacteria bacterium]|nr:NADH-quinone oxidoreductase subunit H [Candidatus Kaiserbacteria bacterium]